MMAKPDCFKKENILRRLKQEMAELERLVRQARDQSRTIQQTMRDLEQADD